MLRGIKLPAAVFLFRPDFRFDDSGAGCTELALSPGASDAELEKPSAWTTYHIESVIYPCLAMTIDCRGARREAGGLVGVASVGVTFCLFVRLDNWAGVELEACSGLGRAEDEALRFLILGGGR